MKKILLVLAVLVIFPVVTRPAQLAGPFIISSVTPPVEAQESTPVYAAPHLVIPKIALNKEIAPVGLTKGGAMDVLDDPARVGWYKGGAEPGAIGSAVLDAHVYQAFRNLKELAIGDEIFVAQSDGSELRFVIREKEVYPYTDTAHLTKIFSRTDIARLNLITCYGDKTDDGSTYTHRLVVYAELV